MQLMDDKNWFVQTADELCQSATSDGTLFDERHHVSVISLGHPDGPWSGSCWTGSIPSQR